MSINANVMTWAPEQRRIGSLTTLGIAAVIAIAGLAVWWFANDAAAWIYWTLVGVLALVLAFQLALLFAAPRTAAPVEAGAHAHAATPMEAPAEAPPATPSEPQVLTLRCGDCGTVFDVTDTGERPLYHTCPGCGAEGALRAPEAAEASPYAPPPEAAYAPPAEAAQPAVATPAPAAVKRMKLRCGGCKEIFVIDDSGERPLKRPCPHCGRTGVIH